jgi:DNA-binding transcriptional MerR regulator
VTDDPRRRLLYADEAATLVGKQPTTIRTWVHRKWLKPFTTGRNGRSLFLEADVLIAEKNVRQRQR